MLCAGMGMDLRESKNNVNRHPWELARVTILGAILHQYCCLRENLGILDVGCGDAFVAYNVFRGWPNKFIHGYDVYLTEEKIKQFSMQYPDVSFLNRPEDLQKNIYDVVFLLDVLEHVKDDQDTLSQVVSDYLKPEGLVLIIVPAFQPLFSKHDEFLKHYRRYSRYAINNLIEMVGLKKISDGYLFSSLLIPRMIDCCLEKIMPGKNKNIVGIGSWTRGPFLTNIIKMFLDIDNQLLFQLKKLGIKIPGLSIWAVCRKRG